MPSRTRDSEISRAVTEVHSRRVQSERAASGDQNRTVRSASRRPFSIFRNEIVAQFDIDLAEPWLDVLSFKLVGERLNELLVFRAVGKKDFHPVGDPLGDIIAVHRLEGKTSSSQKGGAR
jgi:hypothetical protein